MADLAKIGARMERAIERMQELKAEADAYNRALAAVAKFGTNTCCGPPLSGLGAGLGTARVCGLANG
jgi:hypothetical protein